MINIQADFRIEICTLSNLFSFCRT